MDYPRTRSTWRTIVRRALVGFAVLIALLGVGVVAAMVAIQSGWAEGRLERLAAERTGRAVDLEGLRMRAAWPPQVELAALRVANPDWAQDRDLIDARGLRASVAPAELLRGRIVVTAALDDAAAGLEKRGEDATWTLGERGGASSGAKGQAAGPGRFSVRAVSIGAVRATYRDRAAGTEVVVRASGELGREGRPFRTEAQGRLRNESLRASAHAPAVPLAGAEPVQVSFEAELGDNRAAGQVALRAAADALESIQGRVEASGPSVAALDRVAGTDLPKSAPYRVALEVRHEGSRWIVENLRVALGGSDLQGSASLEVGRERPLLRASLTSSRFDMQETGIKPKVKKELEERKYLFSREPWPSVKFDALDADVELSMKELHNTHPVPLDALELRVVLDNATLRVDPLKVSLGGGTVSGRVALEAGESPERASVNLDIRALRLSRLVPKLEKQKETALGRLNGRVELAGSGESPAKLVGSADGRIVFAAERGQASALLVEVLGLDAAEAITLIGKKREQPLACAVMDLAVKQGKATTSAFVIDTTDTVLSVEGSANLGEETLDLTARAEPRDASIFSLRTPANITGTFLDPKVRPRAGPLAGRAAALTALAALNPILALIPFVDPGGDPEPGCQPQKH
jgi:uncharacterized protein involved in outer membrane biogenesis